jgi:hypothetical protein
VSQLPFGYVLLFDIPEDLSHVVLEYPIASEHFLGRFSSQYIDLSIVVFVYYKILDIGLDLIESYSPKITNRINYLGCFRSKQVLVEENINIY